MNFSDTYRRMNASIAPSQDLTRKVCHPRRHAGHRGLAVAATLAVCLSTTALAAQTEPGYRLLYLVSPAAAQFFQPVRLCSTDNGVSMEVLSVHVEGNTAQAYIALTGDAVDETCDLFDSYSFHLPFDQIGHCEQVGYDASTHTAVFLCTTETMDGSPVPVGGKMTFSVGCFLSGQEKVEGAAVEMDLTEYAGDRETLPIWRTEQEGPFSNGYQTSGGGYEDEAGEALMETAPLLLPGNAIAEPVQGLSLTAAGYVEGLLHIQVCRGDATALDNHCWLWLEDGAGERLERVCSIGFSNFAEKGRLDYTEFLFDVPSERLGEYMLYGDFYTSSTLTKGDWRVTFPLEDFTQ